VPVPVPVPVSVSTSASASVSAPVVPPPPPKRPTLREEVITSQPLRPEVAASRNPSGSPAPSASRKRAASIEGSELASQIPVDTAKCKALIQKLSEVQYGWIFALPVDSTQPGLES
jgi:hypothetical protein